MESDNSTSSTSGSEDRELQAMLVRIEEWKSRGYNVSRLESLRHDPKELTSVFFDFLDDLHTLEAVEEELNSLDPGDFTTYADVIRSKLKDPDMAEETRYELAELKQKIERSKLDVDVGRSAERISSAMRRGFSLDSGDDVLREELRRIREEESEKIRNEEMDRIRHDELEKIRKQERKRLIKKESGKMRREARDREFFQKTVKKTIKAVEMSRKKYKKCPGCGGKIEIHSDKRPLRVKCDECGKECILRGDSENNYRRCKCGNIMGIPSSVRPLKITCNKCSHSYLLKEKYGRDTSPDEDIQIVEAPRKSSKIPVKISRKKEMEDMRRTQEDILSKIGSGGQGRQGAQGSLGGQATSLTGQGETPESRDSLLEGKNYAIAEPTDIKVPLSFGQDPSAKENGLVHCPSCKHAVEENFNVCGFCGYVVKGNVLQTQDLPPPPGVPAFTAPPAMQDSKPAGLPGSEPVQIGAQQNIVPTMAGNAHLGAQPMQGPKIFGPAEQSGRPELSPPVANPTPPAAATQQGFPSPSTPPSAAQGPKFCPQCGGDMTPGSKFCGSCGFSF